MVPLILLLPESLVTQLSHLMETCQSLTSFSVSDVWCCQPLTPLKVFLWFPYHYSLDAFASVMSFLSRSLGNLPVLSSHCFVLVHGWRQPLPWFQWLSMHLWVPNISLQPSPIPWAQDPRIQLFTEHLYLRILPTLQFQYIQSELMIYHLNIGPTLYYYF